MRALKATRLCRGCAYAVEIAKASASPPRAVAVFTRGAALREGMARDAAGLAGGMCLLADAVATPLADELRAEQARRKASLSAGVGEIQALLLEAQGWSIPDAQSRAAIVRNKLCAYLLAVLTRTKPQLRAAEMGAKPGVQPAPTQ